MKILKMKKMGMNIYKGSELEGITDLTNFRYYIYNLELANGQKLDVMEVMNGARWNKKSMETHKAADHKGTWFTTYFRDNDGACHGLLDIDKELNKGNYSNSNLYTKQTILEKINSISKIKYDEIKEVGSYD